MNDLYKLSFGLIFYFDYAYLNLIRLCCVTQPRSYNVAASISPFSDSSNAITSLFPGRF